MNYENTDTPQEEQIQQILYTSSNSTSTSYNESIEGSGFELLEGSINTLNENDLQFLLSNNFVVLGIENTQKNGYEIIKERVSHTSPSSTSLSAQSSYFTSGTVSNNTNASSNTVSTHQTIEITKSTENIDIMHVNSNDNQMKQTKKSKKSNRKNLISILKKQFKCDVCNEMFSNYKILKDHKNVKHTLEKNFKCDKCMKEYNFEYNFSIHLATHWLPLEKNYTCPICHNKFQRLSSFKGHLEYHYENDNYKCNECNEEFEYKINYEIHKNEHQNYEDQKETNDDNTEKSENFYHKNDNDVILENIEMPKKRNTSPSSNEKKRKYECGTCKMKFIKPALLRRHQITHTKLKPYECFECNQRFTQKSSLDRHKTVHTGEKHFNCPKCSMKFSQKSNLILHIKRLHSVTDSSITNNSKSNKYPCKDCSCVFNKLNTLNRHRSKIHSKIIVNNDNQNQIVSDDIDEITINNVMNELKSWQKLMSYESSPPTITRSSSISNSENDQTFFKNFNENPSKIVLNNSNNENYDKDKTTVNHQQYENQQIHEVYEAVEGIEATTNNEENELIYRLIEREIIGGVTYFKCLSCNKLSRRAHDILRHIRVHTQQKNYQCEICKRNFSLKFNLKTHMKIHQKNESLTSSKLYECYACKEIFNSFKQLDVHVKSQHNDETLFKCLICDKKFKNIYYLKMHTLNHLENKTKNELNINKKLLEPIHIDDSSRSNGDVIDNIGINDNSEMNSNETIAKRDYQCTYCGLQFKRMYHLKQHEEIHSNKRELYSCNICEKTLSSMNSLNCHLKFIHFNLKRFKCSICSGIFTKNGNLKRHILAVHMNRKNFKCRYCDKLFKAKEHCRRHIITHFKNQSETKNDVDNTRASEEMNQEQYNNENMNNFVANENHEIQHQQNIQENLEKDDIDFTFKQNVSNTIHGYENSIDFSSQNHQNSNEIIQEMITTANKTATTITTSNDTENILDDFDRPSIILDNVIMSPLPLPSSTMSTILTQNNGQKFIVEGDIPIIGSNQQFPTSYTLILNESSEMFNESSILIQPQPELQKEPEPQYNNSFSTYYTSSLPSIVEERISTIPIESQPHEKQINPNAVKTICHTSKFLRIDNSFEANSEKLPKNIIIEQLDKPLEINLLKDKNTKNIYDKELQKESSKTTLENSIKCVDRKKRYNCTYCSKSFQKPSDLARHMRIHTNDKPFKCEICSKAFTLKNTLENHLITHNENRKFYNCQVCDKKYASFDVLKVHLRIHTGERPYKCEYCTETFRTSGHRTAHIKSHHKNKFLSNSNKKKKK